MTRTSTGLCLAAAFGLAVSLGAQTTTSSQTRTMTDKDHDSISVTGCLQRDASGGFVLANAHIDKTDHGASTTTTTGTTTGTTGTTTGTTATTTTAGSESSSMMPSATWKLEGGSSELDRHLGHRVTVTGREISSSSPSTSAGTTTGTTATTGTTGTTEEQKRYPSSSSQSERRLDVQSVKMISSSCS